MVFEWDSVHSKGEKRPFLRHKSNDIGTLAGSDPAGNPYDLNCSACRAGRIFIDEVVRLLEIEEKDLSRIYQARIKEALRKGCLSRDDIRTVKLAVGDEGFVEKIKNGVGSFVSKLNVKEESAAYGPVEQIFENSLKWEIFDESEL